MKLFFAPGALLALLAGTFLLGAARRAPNQQRPASLHVNGYYAYLYTDTPQDQEDSLRAQSGGVFTRIPGNGSGKLFRAVCRDLNKTCGHVRDWESRGHGCGAGAHDGSRMAYCTSFFPAGFYGYAEVDTPLDREAELQRHSGNTLIRLLGARGGTFNRLCRRIGRTCAKVVTWEGREVSCRANPTATDGSRMVYCQ